MLHACLHKDAGEVLRGKQEAGQYTFTYEKIAQTFKRRMGSESKSVGQGQKYSSDT